MINYKNHLILTKTSIREALSQLTNLGIDAILFVVDKEDKLIGSITDGDVRRGLVKGVSIDESIDTIITSTPKFIIKNNFQLNEIISIRNQNFRIIPVLDFNNKVVNVINFRNLKSYLPLDVVIMAGGRGERLKPFTDQIPKPLMPVGGKEIINHNIERLISFGVSTIWITVRYLKEKIISKIGNGQDLGVSINYISEEEPLGTIGAVSLISNFEHENILIMNSDILTNLDYEQFFLDFIENESDFSVATIPYTVSIPYAILETEKNKIINFQEKPTYTYFSNAGIYIVKKSILNRIPLRKIFNATDLLVDLIYNNFKVTTFPLRGYWLDIGNHEDYKKANEDVGFIKF